jgi:hypothetical protein
MGSHVLLRYRRVVVANDNGGLVGQVLGATAAERSVVPVGEQRVLGSAAALVHTSVRDDLR